MRVRMTPLVRRGASGGRVPGGSLAPEKPR
jgi:hypothetical protein